MQKADSFLNTETGLLRSKKPVSFFLISEGKLTYCVQNKYGKELKQSLHPTLVSNSVLNEEIK